ncbi:hypothetical protein D3C84_259390 [compost metagenome]
MDRDKIYLAVAQATIDAMPTEQRVVTLRLIQSVQSVLASCPDEEARAATICIIAADNLISMTTPKDPT